MPTLRAAAPLAAIALVMLPAAARAGTVAYDVPGTTLGFTATAGEANRLAVTRTPDRIVFAEHGGLTIATAEPGCTGGGTSVVSCAVAAAVAVGLGDQDDELAVGPLGLYVEADGGDGADRLDAAEHTGFALLTGGTGPDRLFAGLAESDLDGGPGDDVLTGAAAGSRTSYFMGSASDGADAIVGGDGLDVAEYDARAVALRLSADGVADDGEPGERDDIGVAVEAIQGGNAPDVITGSGTVDAELSGYGGDDQLAGGAGDDVLFGGDGERRAGGQRRR